MLLPRPTCYPAHALMRLDSSVLLLPQGSFTGIEREDSRGANKGGTPIAFLRLVTRSYDFRKESWHHLIMRVPLPFIGHR